VKNQLASSSKLLLELIRAECSDPKSGDTERESLGGGDVAIVTKKVLITKENFHMTFTEIITAHSLTPVLWL